MSLSLPYKIISGPPAIAKFAETPDEIARYRRLIDVERELLRSAVILSAQNVSDYYYESEQRVWGPADFPNVAPPWPYFCVFWEDPNIDGESKAKCDLLCLCGAHEATDAMRAEFVSVHCDKGIGHERLASDAARAKWFLFCVVYGSIGEAPTFGHPIRLNAHTLLVDETGLMLDGGVSESTEGLSAIHVLGLSLCFTNCKNVQLVNAPSDLHPSDKWLRRMKQPKLSYRILQIDRMKRVLQEEGNASANGIPKAMHICRGHFATYTEEKPLFGHTVGQVFRPCHVRGKLKNGLALKDYEVMR